MRGRRTSIYVVSGFAALATAGGGLAAALPSAGPVSKGVRAPDVGSASPQLSAAAQTAFSVFAQPAGSGEDLRVVAEITRGDSRVALDPASVHLARTINGIEALVGGDSESVCNVGRIPGGAIWGGCSPEVAAAAPGTPVIATTGYPPGQPSRSGGQLAVTALFPDGTTGITVTAPDKQATPLDLVNNTIAFVANQDATLSWTGPEGQRYSSALPH